jgi:hypothetical protein
MAGGEVSVRHFTSRMGLARTRLPFFTSIVDSRFKSCGIIASDEAA